MSSSRNSSVFLVISGLALILSGCGGGGNDQAAQPLAPGNCAVGQLYSTQYGCMSTAGCNAGMAQSPQGSGCVYVGNTSVANCAQTNQGPMVYAGQQYGCLPQGSCSPGMGAYMANGTQQCVPAQSQGSAGTGCTVGQIMTEKGCLPEGAYPCSLGEGNMGNRCYPGSMPMESMPTERTPSSRTKTNDVYTGYGDDSESSQDSDRYWDPDYDYRPSRSKSVTKSNTVSVSRGDCVPHVKTKNGGRKVKITYDKKCK